MNCNNRMQTLIAVVLLALLGGQVSGAHGALAATSVAASTPGVNVWVMALEVTQATQTWLAVAERSRSELAPEVRASEEMVPLVRGKRTVVRVYPGMEGGSGVIAEVGATLTCQNADTAPCSGPAVVIPVSPIPLDPGDHNDLDTQRKDAARTLNFVLPEAWTTVTEPISLTAKLSTPAGMPECPACQDGANSLTLGSLLFHPTAPLELHIIYACVRRHASDPPAVCDHAPLDIHEDIFLAGDSLVTLAFPIAEKDFRLALHDPITIAVDGDFSLPGGPMTPERTAAFGSLVCDLARHALGGDAPPLNVIYIGLLPAPTLDIAGFGARNCIVARTDGPDVRPNLRARETVIHELGHALGRPHAGCGIHGEPAPCDPIMQVFPCSSSGICTYGFDSTAMRVIDLGDPPNGIHAHDFMSYGTGQQWVSPYTYRRLYDTLCDLLG